MSSQNAICDHLVRQNYPLFSFVSQTLAMRGALTASLFGLAMGLKADIQQLDSCMAKTNSMKIEDAMFSTCRSLSNYVQSESKLIMELKDSRAELADALEQMNKVINYFTIK